MKTSSCLMLSAYPSTQPTRKLRKTTTLALRQRLSYGKPRRKNTGKEYETENGINFYEIMKTTMKGAFF